MQFPKKYINHVAIKYVFDISVNKYDSLEDLLILQTR